MKIYLIENPEGLKYVGMTRKDSLDIRYLSLTDPNKPTKIQESLNKHGIKAHKISVLEECNDKEAGERKQFWIKKLETRKELNKDYDYAGFKTVDCQEQSYYIYKNGAWSKTSKIVKTWTRTGYSKNDSITRMEIFPDYDQLLEESEDSEGED